MSDEKIRPLPSATTDVPVVTPAPDVAVPPVVPEPQPTPTPTPPSTPSPEPIAARFSQLAAQRREAEARAERLERTAMEQAKRIETLLATLSKPAAPAPAVVPTPSPDVSIPRPMRDAFADQESYETALVSWSGERAAATAATELRRAQEEAEAARLDRVKADEETRAREAREAKEAETAQEIRTAWESRRAKAIEAHPDFAEVAEAESLPISDAMGHVIVTNDVGPEIAYYLGKNPQEAVRIASMVVPGQVFPAGHPRVGLPVPNAVAQAFELGKIAAQFGGTTTIPPTAPAPASVPSVVLPAPPAPIGGTSAAATRKSPGEMTMEEYAAERLPKLISERRPGRIH